MSDYRSVEHNSNLQHRTDDLVRAVEGLDGQLIAGMYCLVCEGEGGTHQPNCAWLALQAALAAYKEAKESELERE